LNRKIYILVLLFVSHFLPAQFYNLPADYHFSLLTEKYLARKDSSIHAGIKPYIPFFSKKYYHRADSHVIFKYITDDPALDLAFYKHLVDISPKKEKYTLRIDPILAYDKGRDFADTITRNIGTNTRGFVASASIGSDFYCETIFSENQSYFPVYLRNYANSSAIVPGLGRHKPFKTTGFDYAFATGFFSYQMHKNINIQAGHGKQKIGNGYRSLLLSDNAFNYPYARITQQWFGGRLQYSTIYAVLMNLQPATAIPVPNTERLFQKKPASFQYLSMNLGKSINVGLFQGFIAEANNAKNKPMLEAMFASPVLFSQAAYYGLNNKNNVLLGADALLKLTNTFQLYGQCMVDDLSGTLSLGNGIGFQSGIKYFDAFGISNLFFQAEYNQVSETAYISPIQAFTNQSYSHYGQNIAFTPAAGNEWVFVSDYKYQRFYFNARYHIQTGIKNKTADYTNTFINSCAGYLINPAYNLCVNMGYVYRYRNFNTFNIASQSTHHFYIGIKTNLYNTYFDF